MLFHLDPHHHNVPDDQLLQDLRAVAERFPGQRLTYGFYNLHGIYHGETVRARFCGWNKALAKIGLLPNFQRDVPTEELFANLETVWRRLGKAPRQFDLAPPMSRYGYWLYTKRFGGWRKALEAFVAAINARGEDSSDFSTASAEIDTANPPGHKTSRTITWQLRFKAMQRDGFRCRACGRSPATEPGVQLQVDHIIPWSRGGETVLENLQALCAHCNGGKSDLPWDDGKVDAGHTRL